MVTKIRWIMPNETLQTLNALGRYSSELRRFHEAFETQADEPTGTAPSDMVAQGRFPCLNDWLVQNGYREPRPEIQPGGVVQLPLRDSLKKQALQVLARQLRQYAADLQELQEELEDEELGVGQW